MSKSKYFAILILCSFSLSTFGISAPKREYGCNLNEGNLPEVVLIGEEYTNKYSVAIKKLLFMSSIIGVFPLASETTPQLPGILPPFFPNYQSDVSNFFGINREKSLVHGIESEVQWAVNTIYISQIENLLSLNEEERRSAIYHLVLASSDVSLYKKALTTLVEKAKVEGSSESNEILSMLLTLKDLAAIPAFREISDEDMDAIVFQKFPNEFTGRKCILFLSLFHEEVIKIVNEKYLQYFGGVGLPIIKTEGDLDRHCYSKNSCESFRKKIGLLNQENREWDLAQNVADLMCHYKNKFSHLVVVTGAFNVGKIENIINQLSNGNVRVSKFFSAQPNQMKLIQKIREIRRLSNDR